MPGTESARLPRQTTTSVVEQSSKILDGEQKSSSNESEDDYTVKKNLGLKPSKYGLPRKNLLKLVCFPVGSYPSSY